MERNAKFLIGLGLFCLGALAIGFYAYEQSREYLRGPQVVIDQPTDGQVFSTAPIVISGNAQNVAYITLDGASIFVDAKGDFSQKLLLEPGYNILTVAAQDRFGKKVEKTLELVYTAPEAVASTTPQATTTVSA